MGRTSRRLMHCSTRRGRSIIAAARLKLRACTGRGEQECSPLPWDPTTHVSSLPRTGKGSGYKVLQGQLSAVQKEVIEASKINECRNGVIGRLIWHFVHHTPVHLFGGGPFWGY